MITRSVGETSTTQWLLLGRYFLRAVKSYNSDLVFRSPSLVQESVGEPGGVASCHTGSTCAHSPSNHYPPFWYLVGADCRET